MDNETRIADSGHTESLARSSTPQQLDLEIEEARKALEKGVDGKVLHGFALTLLGNTEFG